MTEDQLEQEAIDRLVDVGYATPHAAACSGLSKRASSELASASAR